jgi:hypothetical protein
MQQARRRAKSGARKKHQRLIFCNFQEDLWRYSRRAPFAARRAKSGVRETLRVKPLR